MATATISNIGTGKCKVMVVDDHPIIRQGLTRMFAQEPDIVVCGDADNVADAMEQIRKTPRMSSWSTCRSRTAMESI